MELSSALKKFKFKFETPFWTSYSASNPCRPHESRAALTLGFFLFFMLFHWPWMLKALQNLFLKNFYYIFSITYFDDICSPFQSLPRSSQGPYPLKFMFFLLLPQNKQNRNRKKKQKCSCTHTHRVCFLQASYIWAWSFTDRPRDTPLRKGIFFPQQVAVANGFLTKGGTLCPGRWRKKTCFSQ